MKDQAQNTIGFILLTHSNPGQFLRLVGRLNHLYTFPPIVCHHDFTKCELPLDKLTDNISFVRPHLETGWGSFAITEATVLAIQHMLKRPDCPNWFVLLSGADYPIKPAAKVLEDLNAGAYDAYMDYDLIHQDKCDTEQKKDYCDNRYLCKYIHIPYPTKRPPFIYWRKIKLSPRFASPFVPFSSKFLCYAGSQWFSFNRQAAEYIIKESDLNHACYKHFRSVIFAAEEAYFQTTLVNTKSLNVHNNYYRYIDWSRGGPHPKTLEMEDFSKFISSSAHFARKFDANNGDLLDAIDRAVDNPIVILMSKSFDKVVKEKFRFLVTDYAFKLNHCNKVDGGFDILFVNNMCGVHIVYEFREAYLFITIHKLQNGTFIDNPRPITQKSILTGFSLDDILSIRSPNSIIKPAYAYGEDSKFYDKKEGLSLYVSLFADNLKDHASDILMGDFRIFKTLEPIVRKRIQPK